MQTPIAVQRAAPAEAPTRRATRADNGPIERAILLAVVLLPLAAVAIAIVQLWERQVYPIDVAMLVVMYVLIQMGVTVGFHRYLTHRSFVAPGWLKFVLLVLGSMGIEGPALRWASTHLEHHALSDKEGDPHSPLDGFVHAHIGWIIDGFNPDPGRYGHWLQRDPIVVFVSRTFWLWVVLSLAIPFAIDGWRGLIWAGLVRVFLVHHVTWSVNSICHTFGSRPFQTGDRSTNNLLVALLAGGEGWHNNHHAFQRSAFHGLHWWQLDLSGMLIRLLEMLRIVKDVQRVTPEQMQRRLSRNAEMASYEAS